MWRSLSRTLRAFAHVGVIHRFLGYEPRSPQRFWEGNHNRVDVKQGSEEFNAVADIFLEVPAVKSFYKPHVDRGAVDVARIERIQNRALHDSLETGYGIVKSQLEKAGVAIQGGVHTRWLFHGTSKEVLDDIVEEGAQGFQPLLNEKHIWGQGIYFARDSAYSWHSGWCNDCIDKDGHKMIIMCLVSTGIPLVGEEEFKNMPKIHEDMRPRMRYHSFIDCPSNPEIFVVQKNDQVYPAYVIHFS